MTATMTPYRRDVQVGRDGFAQLLHAEWTKLRTVRGWMVGLGLGAVLMVLVGLLGAMAVQLPQKASPISVGPEGQPVRDSFYYVHQSLTGNGSITVAVHSLIEQADAGPEGQKEITVPWAKAGILIKESIEPTSAYAAIMVTPSHGVRMQHDYIHDTAGLPGTASTQAPRWLRLTRTGGTITGYNSVDGSHWTEVGTVRPARLPDIVQVGLFVTSPDYIENANTSTTSIATAAFGAVDLRDGWSSSRWTGTEVGGDPRTTIGGHNESANGFTIRGAGDIAPITGGIASPGNIVMMGNFLIGAFVGLIAVMVVGTTFITAEYRRGLIRTTLTASPRRARVLLAKAVVLGAVTFVVGLVAAVVAILLCEPIAKSHGFTMFPVSRMTELRVLIGTAALLAVGAILALAVGAILRRSAGAVAIVVAAVILPYILATSSILPESMSNWLLRLTPAAGFAIQQTVEEYPQVFSFPTPSTGFFPLSPLVGFAVLCGYALLALGLAVVLIRRRDV
jgi:ABC-type transport system involved in multi-copper enzyme maturation permease subunit